MEASKEFAEATVYSIYIGYVFKIRADHNIVHCTRFPSLTILLVTFILFQPLFHRRFPVNLELIYCSA